MYIEGYMMKDITLVFLKANLKPYNFSKSLFEVSVEVEVVKQENSLFCYHVEMVYQEEVYMDIWMHYRVSNIILDSYELDEIMYQIHPYFLDIIEALLKQNQIVPHLLTS